MGNATTDYLQLEPYNLGEAPRCPRCGNYTGMLPWLPPYRAELTVWGDRFGDVASGPDYSRLVSKRFKTLWQAEGLVGLEGFDPVEVVRVRRRRKGLGESPAYFHVTIVRSAVAVDQERSGMQWDGPPTCDVCRLGRNLKGYERIVPESEPAENICRVRGVPATVLVNEQFRMFCEKHQIGNCHLIPAAEAEYWTLPKYKPDRGGRGK
jgi:hypothetical protein